MLMRWLGDAGRQGSCWGGGRAAHCGGTYTAGHRRFGALENAYRSPSSQTANRQLISMGMIFGRPPAPLVAA